MIRITIYALSRQNLTGKAKTTYDELSVNFITIIVAMSGLMSLYRSVGDNNGKGLKTLLVTLSILIKKDFTIQ